jgi:hypothetical protein
MGSKSGGGGVSTIHFVWYVEDKHSKLVETSWAYINDLMGSSPYANFTAADVDDFYFASGEVLGDFPSVHSLFLNRSLYINPDSTYRNILYQELNSSPAWERVDAEKQYLNDDLNQNILPKVRAFAQSINAVKFDSSFMHDVAKANFSKQRAIGKYAEAIHAPAFEKSISHWTKYLSWNQVVVDQYLKIAQSYLVNKFDATSQAMDVAQKNVLWPFRLYGFQSAFLGAVTGGIASNPDSMTSQYISGAFGVASIATELWATSRKV